MDELAAKWQDLTDIQQASVTELIAGKRQGNIVSSLMTNFDIARNALETSLKSTGSAMREHEKWQKSLEARINSLKASWQSLSQTFMSSSFLKVVINGLTGLVDVIEHLIGNFGLLGTAIGGVGLFKFGKNLISIIAGTTTLQSRVIGLKFAFKDLAKSLVIMSAIRAATDIISLLSDAFSKAETAAEKFDRVSEELASAESELSSLESELSSVESQINALLEKDELSFTDEEELSRLRKVSSELERQIELTETLRKSLQESLNTTSIDAFDEYAKDTSFYSDKSKQERKDEAKSMGSSIGNAVGLALGTVIGGLAGGNFLAGAAIGSTLGSLAGGAIGGVTSNASYDNETTVLEMLDDMRIERAKLEKAKNEAYEVYADDPTTKNLEKWEEARAALDEYNTALATHISQLSEYYNAIDSGTLKGEDLKEYIKMGDYLDKYNIEMGVNGAKTTAFNRIFSDELITEEAKQLRAEIEATLNSGEKINFADFDSEQFVEIKNRLSDIGLTIVDVVSYFDDLEEAQADAFDYDTYDMVSNIATLSDGVAKLSDAFKEFNEQGIVSAATLVELNELFGNAGDAWKDYVDVMTSGISSVEEARDVTEQLAESHLKNLFSSGGIRFSKFNEESGKYEFDKDNYLTYLSTINELEYLGVDNAKEYIDALQQQAMFKEAAAQMARDSAEKEALLAKETLTEKQKTRLNTLESKKIDDYIFDIENDYGIHLKDTGLLQKQYDLNEYNSILKDRENSLSGITKYLEEYQGASEEARYEYKKYKEANDKADEIENEIYQDARDKAKNGANVSSSGMYVMSWDDWEAIDDLFGTNLFDTKHDEVDKYFEDAEAHYDIYKDKMKSQKKMFDDLVNTAKDSDIDLSDIEEHFQIDLDKFKFDAKADNADEIFEQVYNKVKSELESSVDKYEGLANEISKEIEDRLNNLGLEIDFGRHFDKIIIDGFKTKIDQIGTARSEMFSSGGLSTDSIIAIDDIFGDLNSYDSSELFENTANGVRLNTEEFKRLNDEFKKTNIDGLEDKISDLGDQYVKTREELYNLTYGTEEYNAKARELSDIESQIEANKELISQYKGLFSAYQEWQRAESSGSERNMYESILEGFENVGDEISRGWIDDGTREFLELLKGEKATIIDGNGNKKEINIATASAKELKQVWKGLDNTIKHTTYSVQDFFTVDEEGNSTSKGVYNWLDAIGQMEEEMFDGKDVVKRKDGKIIGFDFQIVGGDKAIAEALGISEELVQIMKRAAIDAGFVVTFDGSYEQLDVLREKAETAAKEMNEILKADGKATIDIDLNADSVDEIQPQIDKIMETFGKKDGNGNLTGAIDMDIKGADKAIQIARTLQSMLDKLTRPAYMDIQISQVEDELREPLTKLQTLRTYTEQEHQIKLSGGDTSQLEESKQEIYNYFESLDPKIKAEIGLVDADGNGLTEESFNKMTAEQKIEVGYVDENGNPIEDFSEAIRKKIGDGSLAFEATVDIQLDMDEKLGILADKALLDAGLISSEEFTKRVQVYLEAEVNNEDAKGETDDAVGEVVANDEAEIKKNIDIIANVTGSDDVELLSFEVENLDDKTIQTIAEVLGRADVDLLKWTMATLEPKKVEAIAKAIGEGDVDALKTAISQLSPKQVEAIAKALGYNDVDELNTAIEGMDGNTVQAVAEALGITDVKTLQAAINNMKGNTVDAKVDTSGQSEKINTLQGEIDGMHGKTVDIVVNTIKRVVETVSSGGKKKAAQRTGADPAGNDSEVNGTANVNGTAFKKGSWGTKDSGTALVGELGREVLVRDGRYYTIGDDGAEFIKYKKGDIIFNHVQSEELFKNGKVTSGGGRARAFANGTAFSDGYRWDGYGEWIAPEVKSFKVNYDYGDEEKKQEIFDWIEVAIERIERVIDNLDKEANNVYKNWTSRNSALADQINMVGNEIALQQKAYEGYMNAANQIGLPSEWKKKVQDGAIEIDNVTDETLAEKIKDYQKWYEKALDCEDAIIELKETESALYKQRFDNVATQYEGALSIIEHEKNMLEEHISQSEANAWLVSSKYYDALANNERENISKLKQEKNALLSSFNSAMQSGKIDKYSEAW